jgi:hypothetical protein
MALAALLAVLAFLSPTAAVASSNTSTAAAVQSFLGRLEMLYVSNNTGGEC